MDDNLRLEAATPVQEIVPPVIETVDQVPESASQALGIIVPEPTAVVYLEHNMPPPTTDAHAELVITSQAADVPASPLALMLSTSVPP